MAGFLGLFFRSALGLMLEKGLSAGDYLFNLCSQRLKAEAILHSPFFSTRLGHHTTRRPDTLDSWTLGLPKPHGHGAVSNCTSGLFYLVLVSSWSKRARDGENVGPACLHKCWGSRAWPIPLSASPQWTSSRSGCQRPLLAHKAHGSTWSRTSLSQTCWSNQTLEHTAKVGLSVPDITSLRLPVLGNGPNIHSGLGLRPGQLSATFRTSTTPVPSASKTC